VDRAALIGQEPCAASLGGPHREAGITPGILKCLGVPSWASGPRTEGLYQQTSFPLFPCLHLFATAGSQTVTVLSEILRYY
jgi:hypothetical protein